MLDTPLGDRLLREDRHQVEAVVVAAVPAHRTDVRAMQLAKEVADRKPEMKWGKRKLLLTSFVYMQISRYIRRNPISLETI